MVAAPTYGDLDQDLNNNSILSSYSAVREAQEEADFGTAEIFYLIDAIQQRESFCDNSVVHMQYYDVTFSESSAEYDVSGCVIGTTLIDASNTLTIDYSSQTSTQCVYTVTVHIGAQTNSEYGTSGSYAYTQPYVLTLDVTDCSCKDCSSPSWKNVKFIDAGPFNMDFSENGYF